MNNKKIFITFILYFLFCITVNADCSYDERKAMLSDVSKVEISMEPIQNQDNTYSFKFNIANLTDKIYVNYYNTNNGIETDVTDMDLNNGVYSFIDDNSYYLYDYEFTFYSANDNCYAKEISSKSITKPIYNRYSENINCTYENNKDFKYCEKFLYSNYNLTIDKFNEELMKYNIELREKELEKEEEKEKEEDNQDKETNFGIVIAIIVAVVIVVVGVIVIIIKKKRESLR